MDFHERVPDERAREIARNVNRLAGPAVMHSLLLTGVYLVDALMVGWLGAEALAAVAIAGPVMWGLRSVFNALGRGTLALVARAVGHGDEELAGLVAQESLAAALLLSLAATPLSGCAGAIYAFFGAEPGVAALGAQFLSVVLAGLPLAILAQVLVVIFQAAGDTRTPLVAGIVANVVNAVANYLLMFGAFGLPRMGVAGSAAGTVLAHGVMVVMLAGALWRQRAWVPRAGARVASPAAARDPGLETATRGARLRAMLRIGTPALAEALAYHSAYMMFARMVAGLGTHALAAHRIAISVESLAFMPADGFNVAASTLTGQCLGAGRPAEALLSIRCALRMGVLWMLPLSLAFAGMPGWIAGCFTSDVGLVSTTATLLALAAIEMPLLAAANVMMGGLQGAGDTRRALAVTLVGAWVVRLPLTWVLAYPLGMGVAGVWLATAIDWGARARIAYAIVHAGRWARTGTGVG